MILMFGSILDMETSPQNLLGTLLETTPLFCLLFSIMGSPPRSLSSYGVALDDMVQQCEIPLISSSCFDGAMEIANNVFADCSFF